MFPVEIQNNDDDVSQRLSNARHKSIEVLYMYSFITIFLFFIVLFVLFFSLYLSLLMYTAN